MRHQKCETKTESSRSAINKDTDDSFQGLAIGENSFDDRQDGLCMDGIDHRVVWFEHIKSSINIENNITQFKDIYIYIYIPTVLRWLLLQGMVERIKFEHQHRKQHGSRTYIYVPTVLR